ncbi:MAG: DUF433 domain-containing protein [Ahrensia sp.]|nr:DUF433 domain-containing protein [Ahrensia sp.]
MSAPLNSNTRFDGLVISDPDVMHGAWVFSGTRIPVETLFQHLASGYSLESIHEQFPSLSIETMQAVLKLLPQEADLHAA